MWNELNKASILGIVRPFDVLFALQAKGASCWIGFYPNRRLLSRKVLAVVTVYLGPVLLLTIAHNYST